MTPRPLIVLDIFDLSSETAERNSTNLDRKHDLNVLYLRCVFRANPENKMAASASDWLKHFRVNFWMQQNLTGSKISMSSATFSLPIGKSTWPPHLWLTETFSTSPLKPLNRIQRNLRGSIISTFSKKFVFVGSIQKNNMAASASDGKRHFRVLLWNRCT